MGLVPAATIFMPSAMMAALRMVAVVVPSPAVSFVFDAACTGRAGSCQPEGPMPLTFGCYMDYRPLVLPPGMTSLQAPLTGAPIKLRSHTA